MNCDVCGTEVGGWSVRRGDANTKFCKACFGSREAEAVVAQKKNQPVGGNETPREDPGQQAGTVATPVSNPPGGSSQVTRSLTGVADLFSGLGWLGVVGSILSAFLLSSHGPFLAIALGAYGVLASLSLVILSLLIKCLTAIESNTARTADLLAQAVTELESNSPTASSTDL